jgi:mannosyltransferase OCH1-like enzyme
MIPKRLFQIWISDKPLPEKFQKYVDTWKLVMPDYEIKIVTLENLKHSPFVDKALEQGLFTVANHYIRCQEVYDNGGIYLDLDVEAVRSFDNLLNNKFFAGYEDKTFINNAVFGAEAGNEFLKRCMTEMDNLDWSKPNIELETGPWLFTRNIDPNLQLYPPSYFYPYHYSEVYNPKCIKAETYCVHHWAKSWGK